MDVLSEYLFVIVTAVLGLPVLWLLYRYMHTETIESSTRDQLMAKRADNSEKKMKIYEEALAEETNIEMLEDFESEKLVRAKKAMLHCICEGMDAKTKEFRKKVKELAKGNTDILRHDDVYKFDEDQEDQDKTDANTREFRKKGNNDIPCHDDVYKFEEDQEDQDNTGQAVADIRTRDISQSSPDTPKADSDTANVDQDTPAKDNEGKRLAVYIGVGEFEKRRGDGKSDGTGAYDDTLNRKNEENMDRINTKKTFENLGFTFKSNIYHDKVKRKTTKEVTKVEVDKFIKDVLDYAVEKKVEIIVVLISSHGEEKPEKDNNNTDKNVRRHCILLEDEYLYTDELLKQFHDKIALRGIPKLFFFQACRSGDDANEEDDVDEGVSISVEVKNTTETKKGEAVNPSDADKHSSDARPRNQTPKVAEVRKPGSGEVVDTNVPEKEEGKDDQSDVNSGKDISDARPKNSNRQKGHLQSIDTNETKSPENIPQVKPPMDNSEAKPSTETQKTNPAVDTTIESIPQQEEIQSITCIADSLVMFASSAGKNAYRRQYAGGWLMTSLCSALDNYLESNQDQDLLEVLTGVIGNIAIDKETTPDKKTQKTYKSAACFSHMLTKDIYL